MRSPLVVTFNMRSSLLAFSCPIFMEPPALMPLPPVPVLVRLKVPAKISMLPSDLRQEEV